MRVYSEGFPKEKIHVHFDKQIYNPDETIWYKVYLLAGSEPSPLSKNMYVEWYDTTGNLVKQTVAPLFKASAKGSFDIPSNYKGQFIHMKAYTRWMLNDDSVFLFSKNIIVNNGLITTRKITPKPTQLVLFPEAGVFVQGINSRVAFKATNSIGMPVLVKGYLVNQKKQVIDTLKVKHDGMGSFYIKPMQGETYQINWTDEFGVKGVTPLPISTSTGITLGIKFNNEKATVLIQRSSMVDESLKQLNLLVHMNQDLLYKVSIKMNERLVQKAEIPIDELPTGVLQFSLFSNDWVPIAERIIFVNNHQHEFNAKMNSILVGLGSRAKNVFEIVVSDTTATNMSLSITDATIASPDQQNIFSNFLLSNELKGYIHNPAYYFKSDTDSITEQLDLVMLTNGWRKFDWNKIKAAIPPTLHYFPETSFMSLKGKVFGAKSAGNNEPMQLNFILVGKDSSKNFLFTPVAPDGSFEQSSVFFYDTVKVYYNFNRNAKLASVTQVKIENGLLRKEPGSKAIYSKNYPVYYWNDSISNLRMNYFLSEQEKLRRSMATATLQEVIVQSKKKNPLEILEAKYTSGLFAGGDGFSFDLTDDKVISAMDILTYLQGKVPGLQISLNGGTSSLSWRGSTPDLFLDEVKADVNLIQALNINNIAFIKVIRPPFFGSFGGGSGGAIAIYSKKGSDARKSAPDSKGMENTLLGGYSKFREFYSPNYEKPAATYEADIRNTLYWNPYILTNKKTPRYRVEFYNNDISKKLQVVLEGVNADGKMIRIVRMIE